MVKKYNKADSNSTRLLLLIGRLLAIVNETEPIPEVAWENWFVREIQGLSTPKTAQNLREIALMVQKALRSSSYEYTDETLRNAIHSMQKIVGESETGIATNDPLWMGKQVVYRHSREEDGIVYGQIVSSSVFPGSSTTYDAWLVKVPPGIRLNADSNAFVFYDGPPYQPGEQVLYLKNEQPIAATILGPGFGTRGSFGFNISFQKGGREGYRYAVPYKDLTMYE